MKAIMRWLRRMQRQEDLERELRSDLELEEEEHRADGLSEEARYAARKGIRQLYVHQAALIRAFFNAAVGPLNSGAAQPEARNPLSALRRERKQKTTRREPLSIQSPTPDL